MVRSPFNAHGFIGMAWKNHGVAWDGVENPWFRDLRLYFVGVSPLWRNDRSIPHITPGDLQVDVLLLVKTCYIHSKIACWFALESMFYDNGAARKIEQIHSHYASLLQRHAQFTWCV